jgi:uncharacterized damage-inducible protein DinB
MSIREARRLAEFSSAVRGSTIKRLRLVPEGLENWRIDRDAMSFADLGQHIIDADEWLFRALEGRKQSPLKGKAGLLAVQNRAEFVQLIDDLIRTGERRRNLIGGMSSRRFAEMMYDHRYGTEVSTWWVVVRGNLDHEIHHRGQIIAYLRMLKWSSKSKE